MGVNKRVINDLFSGIVLTLSLFVTIVAFPLLGFATGLLTPLPIAFYFGKVGRGYGALMLSVISVIIGYIAGIMAGAVFLVEFAAIGVALSEAVRMKLPIGRGVLLSVLVSLIGSAVLLMTFYPSGNKGFPDILSEQIRQNVKETVDTYKKIGLPEEQVYSLTKITERLETFVLRTFPAIAFVGFASIALLNLMALKLLLRWKGIEGYQFEPAAWQAPEPLVWVLITGGVLLLLKDERAVTVGLNLLFVTGSIYFFQGIAIVSFYFKKTKTPLFLRTIGYILILFQQIFTIMVIGFGLFDLWFDFRRLKKEA